MGRANRSLRVINSRSASATRAAERQNMVALFELGRFERNQLSRQQIDVLRNMIDNEGTPRAAAALEISEVTLLRVCAGFGHRLSPKTAAKIRQFFER